MKLQSQFDSFRADALAIANHYSIDIAAPDESKTGLATMHQIHTIISRNRSYDDTHPAFKSLSWPRVLPYDGREYCWLYAIDNADDSHIATLLRKVRDSFKPEESLKKPWQVKPNKIY